MANRALITTLFAEVDTSGRSPSAVTLSLATHLVLGVIGFYLLRHVPVILDPITASRAPVRMVSMDKPNVTTHMQGALGTLRPLRTKTAAGGAGGGQASRSATPHVEPRKVKAPQTIVDPKVAPQDKVLPALPLPTFVLWTPEPIQVKNVVPPPQQVTTSATVQPSLTPPNHEVELSSIQMTSSPAVTEKLAVAPGTTSPLTVDNHTVAQQVPQTASVTKARPTPAAELSISRTEMRQGTATLPPANQVADSPETTSLQAHNGTASQGSAATERHKTGSGDGSSTGAGKNAASSADKASDKAADQATGSAADKDPIRPSTSAVAGNGGTGTTGTVMAGEVTGDHITLPADGHYRAIVVGNTISDAFPEADGIMTDRLTYTVYLQVGLAHNWILQYALPESAEHGISSIRPDAPWPYDVYRPRLKADEVNADAILVHGLINAAGHFEQLQVVYPQPLTMSPELLGNLDKWQFRPAMQQGMATAVEVLLIIPMG